MRVAILGAGALGSFLGGVLARAHDVTLVTRNHEHATLARLHGLRVSGLTEEVAPVNVVADVEAAPPADVYLVTVKAYDTEAIAHRASRAVPEGALVLTLQNGLGNVETLARVIPQAVVLGGATSHGVTYVEPGHVRHAGEGYLRVGSPQGDEVACDRVAGAFVAAGLPCDVVLDLERELWAKVCVNVGINPATAITGLRNGVLLKIPELTGLMESAAREAHDVAVALGVDFGGDDVVERARWVADRTAVNKSSMLQDVERGRRTEIDALCGEIVRAGARVGVPTPLNASLLALVKGIEASTRVG